MTERREYFVVANSFAAPFASDQSFGFATGLTPLSALAQFALDYKHPCGLYAAYAYQSADAYHKNEQPLARWLSNHARKIEEAKSTLLVSHRPGVMELDGRGAQVENPKAGRAEYIGAR